MPNKPRVAVIGIGHLGRHHARVLSEIGRADLVALVDVVPDRLQKYADKYRCEALADYRQLAGKVDAAVVAAPTAQHYEIAHWLFEHGIHALVEKPLTYTTAEAAELVDLASKRGVTLQVGHIERFNPALRTIRTHLDSVAFIETHRLSPYPFRSTDIGVVLDVMIHDLDIILDLVHSPVIEIRANATPVISRVHEDIASARLQFANGVVANITASRISDKVARKMRFFCRSRYVNLDFAARQAWVYTKSAKLDDPAFRPEELDLTGVDNLMDFVFRDLIRVEQVEISDMSEPLKAELESFIDALERGARPQVTGEDALKALELAHEILAECGRHRDKYGPGAGYGG